MCVAPCEGVFFPIRIVGANKGSDLSRNYLVLETERGILDKGTVDQERALPEVLEEVLNLFTYMLHWEGGKPVLNPYGGSGEAVARILRKLGMQVKDDRKEENPLFILTIEDHSHENIRRRFFMIRESAVNAAMKHMDEPMPKTRKNRRGCLEDLRRSLEEEGHASEYYEYSIEEASYER